MYGVTFYFYVWVQYIRLWGFNEFKAIVPFLTLISIVIKYCFATNFYFDSDYNRKASFMFFIPQWLPFPFPRFPLQLHLRLTFSLSSRINIIFRSREQKRFFVHYEKRSIGLLVFFFFFFEMRLRRRRLKKCLCFRSIVKMQSNVVIKQGSDLFLPLVSQLNEFEHKMNASCTVTVY